MNLTNTVLSINHNFPICSHAPVHKGKVRSVYWLTPEDSQRLIQERDYDIASTAQLAIMIISDRISAFECIWHGENDLQGIPGKGAALNAISAHWFKRFREEGLADSHILEVPHPLVWIVQKAQPIMIEAICRQYITGSMWRDYAKGNRSFCGITLPEKLQKNQKLDELLITPSTKGILYNIPGVSAADDVNISRDNIENSYHAFNFNSFNDIALYESLLKKGFATISNDLEKIGQIFVDTKFEFGYIKDKDGKDKMIYMDEVGTPDSSRIWETNSYARSIINEQSKEAFRQYLLKVSPDSDVLLNKTRMQERIELARHLALSPEIFEEVSLIYQDIAEKITGNKLNISHNPKEEIMTILTEKFQLIK